jgi:hypothetical protein
MIYIIVLVIAYANVLFCAAFLSFKMTIAAVILASIMTILAVYSIIMSKNDSNNSKSRISSSSSKHKHSSSKHNHSSGIKFVHGYMAHDI